ncbi:MAG TPA: PilC/PilY family type IV pilus protein [Polyangia bacterium]|nr:PilC/PilY family type IV pilus protein [Polyangia bacterium]
MTLRRRFASVALFTATTYYLALLLPPVVRGPWGEALGEGTAQARVNPLSLISRQIHKPNILVVFDTSGSLTGVPGGGFDYPTEVGVDCDDGVNCRGGKAMGTCQQSKKVCLSDADCSVNATCGLDGAACVQTADCAPQQGTCTQLTCNGSNQNCQYAGCMADGDCPASTTGKCAANQAVCSPVKPCTPNYKCAYGTSSCSSTSTPCAPYKLCKDATGNLTATQCNSSNDCPLKPTGTCAVGGAACTGTSVTTCSKVCPDDATACALDANCGICSKGTSNLPGGYCTAVTDCSKSGKCNSNAGDCNINNNSCIRPHYDCQEVQANNPCNNLNACVGPANTCTPGPTNACVPGTPGDLCNAGNTATTASRMCRITQIKCDQDSDCTTAGDSCGPATSRVVIAKRVLSDIVSKNANIANFGLMTFYQKNYFPYFSLSGVSTKTVSTFLSHGRLQGKKCFDKDTGPTAKCTIDGVEYTLTGSGNSTYRVRGSGGQDVDTNWCGFFCPIGGKGTGNYRGSTYTYSVQVGTTSTTKSVQASYLGKTTTISGVPYRYYDSVPNYYNPYGTTTRPPIDVADCNDNICEATCGARWDAQLAPFMDTSDDPEKATTMVSAIMDRMEPASYGGLIAYGGTPTGCSLKNSGAANENSSAYHYMSKVKAADTVKCRKNYVLLITDGEANGPGDTNCGSAACSNADPKAAGCGCRAVLAAQELKAAGFDTLVVGFSGDVTAGNGRLVNDNIAKAGNTDRGNDGKAPYAYAANNEEELTNAIQEAIYDAAKGSYATSPPTSSAGLQLQGKVTLGSYALDSRVDFPSWKGHLIAYDTSTGSPSFVWDAAVQLASVDWKTRRVYTSDSSNHLIQVQVGSTGAISNKAALHSLGLGATDDEAEKIARWMLGDPAQGNAAVLGALVNSTPIDVGQPGAETNDGGLAFADKYKDRPHITYVGSDDGMLHGFYTTSGKEAFAYIPPEMLNTVTSLYSQGGQVPDPTKHIFGMASSPKVKSLCTANCSNKVTAAWKTVLAMTDGFGGNESFMLDVTDPTASPPFSVLWHSANNDSATKYNTALGQTISVPAFYYNHTTLQDEYRLVFTSGYPVTAGSTDQGRWIVAANAATGEIVKQSKISQVGGCGTTPEFTLLTDVATSRDYQTHNQLLGAYAGDTWGNLWRYTAGADPAPVLSLGCTQPLHYTPTVVQLDRDDVTNHPREIFLVQATNSPLDDVTKDFAASRLLIRKEVYNAKDGTLNVDSTFGSGGMVTLTVGSSAQMCGISNATGTSCTTALPATSRPLGTPLAILKQDGTGFTIMSSWFTPDAQGCTKGTTYLQLHQVNVNNGQVTLKQALKISDEPVSSPIIAGDKIVIMTSTGPVLLSGNITQTFIAGQSTPAQNGSPSEPFKILGWSESL